MFLFDSKRGNGACQRSVTAHDLVCVAFATNDKIRPEDFVPLFAAAHAHPSSSREQTTFDRGLA
jgi:hypothetical protein